MPLAVVEAHRLDAGMAVERPTKTDGRILAPREQDQRAVLLWGIRQLTRHQIVLCISSTKRGRSIGGAWPMQRVTAAMCCAIPILFAGSSTIVKGTEQQVSVNTPG